ncbi:MAG: c-type cytochrome [Myxococcaceae bacterium]|nr:c-type cytochrome [Myxococcaceae bacterium]
MQTSSPKWWSGVRVFLMVSGCASAPPPQPWTHVGPSRTLEILVRRQCTSCHGVDTVFGAATTTRESPRDRACTAEEPADGFCHVPALASMERFRASWLREFLAAPFPVRPGLAQPMPPTDLTALEIDALVTGWSAEEGPESEASRPSAAEFEQGRALFTVRGCHACHQLGAVPATSSEPGRLLALAPDLAHARRRLTRATLERFLRDPRAVEPTTEMPALGLSTGEARALAGFLVFAPLAAAPSAP